MCIRTKILGCLIFVGAGLLTPIAPLSGHSGGTNADGCHTNRRTGDYHCHNAKPRAPGRTTYCHVVSGERRCGYALRTCNELVDQLGGFCQVE